MLKNSKYLYGSTDLQYWTIFKNRLKNKIRTDRAARHQTGGGPPNIVFTPLEERTMGIIGNDAGAPLSGVQVNPFGTQETGVVDEEIPLLEIQDQENIDLNVDNDMECLIEDVNLSHSQHLEPEPGPSTAPVTCPPPTASVPSARPGPIRRQRTRPRLHSVSEARADILRLEEARIAAEASHAEALQQIASALRAIAECLSGLTAELRQQHQLPARLQFGDFILQLMYNNKDKVAITNAATHESITFGQIVQESMNFAVSLTHLGLRKGQTVSICSENIVQFWSVVVGVACAGAVLNTVNPGYTEEELKHVISITKPTYVVMSPSSYKNLGIFFKNLPHVKKIILLGEEKVDDDNVILYNDMAIANNGINSGVVIVNNRLVRNVNFEEFEAVDVVGQVDNLFVLFSSGTTGMPKGVMLTHLNIIAQCCLPLAMRPDLPNLIITPWFHVMGLVSTLTGFAVGRTAISIAKFDMNLFLKTIEEYKIVQITVVPPILVAASKVGSRYNLSSVELIYSGAAPLQKETIELAKLTFPNVRSIFQGYGMTEASLVVTRFTFNEISIGTYALKHGSVGKVVACLTIKVVDTETREPLGPHQPGEICVKGNLIMKGYVGKDRSEDFDDEGFFKTGDVGYYDEDGCFFIVDRLKELIKYKGYQVAPAELEALLLQHEGIADAGVVGLPDRGAGELPLAFVVRQPGMNVTEKEIQAYVAKKLSNPKHLRGGVRFVDAIPKNPSGKILRKILRQMIKPNTSKL